MGRRMSTGDPPRPNLFNQSYRWDDAETQINLLQQQGAPQYAIEACVKRIRKGYGLENRYAKQEG